MNVIPLHRRPANDPQARACLSCSMRSTALFGVLEDSDLEDVHQHVTQMQMDTDQLLLEAGRDGEAVYTLREGIVRFERATTSGERRILRLAGCGDLLGQELLLKRPLMDDVIACTPVAVCRIPVPVVLQLGQRQPALLHELMQRWQHALEDSHAWLADLAGGSARRRVLKLLAKLTSYGAPGAPTWLPRREEMGDMLGLTVETASRQISRLRREGVLCSLTRRYATVDPAALQRALAEVDRPG